MDDTQHRTRHILTQLEQQLAMLERAGVRWLNVPAASPQPTDEPGRTEVTAPGGAEPVQSELPATTVGADLSSVGRPPSDGDAGALESLREAYHDCTRCKLAPTRRHLVFGVGHERARLMFIGEGPGADEDAQGEPFVGRAGKLLTALILAMGLVRDDVYITNVVKCRPPGNRNPEPDEIASCRPIMQQQIERIDPALIVSLGNVPLKVLKPDAAGITRERGQVFTYGQWQVLPTFHPSYLLRNPAAIDTCWLDFRKALQLAYSDR